MNRKEKILDHVEDLVGDFTYYDRKGDEDLSMDDLNNSIEAKEITISEIVNHFEKCLRNVYPGKQ